MFREAVKDVRLFVNHRIGSSEIAGEPWDVGLTS
jgi:hypothetical protein